MLKHIKMIVFYCFFALLVFGGQIIYKNGLLIGKPALIQQKTIDGNNAMKSISKGPAIIYFWAEWCGVCEMMQAPVSALLNDYSGLTIAIKSGSKFSVDEYMKENGLDWPVVNDELGSVATKYKVQAVPAVFFLDESGVIKLTSVGYTSEIGLRLRMWLLNWI